ncbi:hypothetical protein D3C86_1436380 [compost metagenome]
MAASVSDIIELVCVNITSSTSASHQAPPCHHRPKELASATAALKRSSFTRWPVWSLSAPQA